MATGDQRKFGAALIVASALVFSTAGLFTKGVNAGAWDIIFWRGIFAMLFTTSYVAWRGTARAEFGGMGASGWAAALAGASGTAAFIAAFKLTSVANVSLIYAASPMIAALIAWAWMGERMTRTVLAGSLAAFAGVAVIVGNSRGSTNLGGDLLALWMAVAMALLFAIYRRYPQTPAAGPSVVSSLILLPACLLFSDPFAVPTGEIVTLACFGLVFAIGSVALSEGARRVPAGEAALLSTLEAPFGPFFAFLILAEIPAAATLIGGLIILAAVIGAQLASTNAAAQG